MSGSRSGASVPIRWTSIAFGNGWTLSKEATEGRGRPSVSPRGSSLGMPRIRLVTGATSTRCMTRFAASRLATRSGRPLSPGVSPHQSSPRPTTSAPKARRRWPGWRVVSPPRGRSRARAFADIRRRTPAPAPPVAAPRRRLQALAESRPTGSERGTGRRAHTARARDGVAAGVRANANKRRALCRSGLRPPARMQVASVRRRRRRRGARPSGWSGRRRGRRVCPRRRSVRRRGRRRGRGR